MCKSHVQCSNVLKYVQEKVYGEWEYICRIDIAETKGVSQNKPFTTYAHSELKEFFSGTESQ